MTRCAPSDAQYSALALPQVASTSAPMCRAIWIARPPTPPAPAWISTRCPGCSAAISTSGIHALMPLTPRQAASAAASGADPVPADPPRNRERMRLLQQPCAFFPVGRVDACDLDPQQQFTRAGAGHGDVFQAHRLRAAVAADHPGP